MEVDDLLIDLAASMADVIGLQAGFVQGRCRSSTNAQRNDVVISDLPVGYYPDDAVASRHQVASSQNIPTPITCSWNKGLKYLKSDGYAIFSLRVICWPALKVTLLKGWLKEEANLVAMISLPENLFANAKQSKTIFILQKKSETAVDPFVYPLASLQDASVLMKFKKIFKNGLKGTEI